VIIKTRCTRLRQPAGKINAKFEEAAAFTRICVPPNEPFSSRLTIGTSGRLFLCCYTLSVPFYDELGCENFMVVSRPRFISFSASFFDWLTLAARTIAKKTARYLSIGAATQPSRRCSWHLRAFLPLISVERELRSTGPMLQKQAANRIEFALFSSPRSSQWILVWPKRVNGFRPMKGWSQGSLPAPFFICRR